MSSLSITLGSLTRQDISKLPHRLRQSLTSIYSSADDIHRALTPIIDLTYYEESLCKQFDNDAAWGVTSELHVREIWKKGKSTLSLSIGQLTRLHHQILPALSASLADIKKVMQLNTLSYSQECQLEHECLHWSKQLESLEQEIHDGLETRLRLSEISTDIPPHCDDLLWALTFYLNQATAANRILPRSIPSCHSAQDFKNAFKQAVPAETMLHTTLLANYSVLPYIPATLTQALLWGRDLLINRIRDVISNFRLAYESNGFIKKTEATLRFIWSVFFVCMMAYVASLLPLTAFHYGIFTLILVGIPYLGYQLSQTWKHWTGQMARDALVHHPVWNELKVLSLLERVFRNAPTSVEQANLEVLNEQLQECMARLSAELVELEKLKPSWWGLQKQATRDLISTMKAEVESNISQAKQSFQNVVRRYIDGFSLATNVVGPQNKPVMTLHQIKSQAPVILEILGAQALEDYETECNFISQFFMQWQSGAFTLQKEGHGFPWGSKQLNLDAFNEIKLKIRALTDAGPRLDAMNQVIAWIENNDIPSVAQFNYVVEALKVDTVDLVLRDVFFDFMPELNAESLALLSENQKQNMREWAAQNQQEMNAIFEKIQSGIENNEIYSTLTYTWNGITTVLPEPIHFRQLCDAYALFDQYLGTTVGQCEQHVFDSLQAALLVPLSTTVREWMLGYFKLMTAPRKIALENQYMVSRIDNFLRQPQWIGKIDTDEIESILSEEELNWLRYKNTHEVQWLVNVLEPLISVLPVNEATSNWLQDLRLHGVIPHVTAEMYGLLPANAAPPTLGEGGLIAGVLMPEVIHTQTTNHVGALQSAHAASLVFTQISNLESSQATTLQTAQLAAQTLASKELQWNEHLETIVQHAYINPSYAVDVYRVFRQCRNSLQTVNEQLRYQQIEQNLYLRLDRHDLVRMMEAHREFIGEVYTTPQLLSKVKGAGAGLTADQLSDLDIPGYFPWVIVDLIRQENTLNNIQLSAIYEACLKPTLQKVIEELRPHLRYVKLPVEELVKLVPFDAGNGVYHKNALSDLVSENRDRFKVWIQLLRQQTGVVCKDDECISSVYAQKDKSNEEHYYLTGLIYESIKDADVLPRLQLTWNEFLQLQQWFFELANQPARGGDRIFYGMGHIAVPPYLKNEFDTLYESTLPKENIFDIIAGGNPVYKAILVEDVASKEGFRIIDGPIWPTDPDHKPFDCRVLLTQAGIVKESLVDIEYPAHDLAVLEGYEMQRAAKHAAANLSLQQANLPAALPAVGL